MLVHDLISRVFVGVDERVREHAVFLGNVDVQCAGYEARQRGSAFDEVHHRSQVLRGHPIAACNLASKDLHRSHLEPANLPQRVDDFFRCVGA